jgi:hypothetical protein
MVCQAVGMEAERQGDDVFKLKKVKREDQR